MATVNCTFHTFHFTLTLTLHLQVEMEAAIANRRLSVMLVRIVILIIPHPTYSLSNTTIKVLGPTFPVPNALVPPATSPCITSSFADLLLSQPIVLPKAR